MTEHRRKYSKRVVTYLEPEQFERLSKIALDCSLSLSGYIKLILFNSEIQGFRGISLSDSNSTQEVKTANNDSANTKI